MPFVFPFDCDRHFNVDLPPMNQWKLSNKRSTVEKKNCRWFFCDHWQSTNNLQWKLIVVYEKIVLLKQLDEYFSSCWNVKIWQKSFLNHVAQRTVEWAKPKYFSRRRWRWWLRSRWWFKFNRSVVHFALFEGKIRNFINQFDFTFTFVVDATPKHFESPLSWKNRVETQNMHSNQHSSYWIQSVSTVIYHRQTWLIRQARKWEKNWWISRFQIRFVPSDLRDFIGCSSFNIQNRFVQRICWFHIFSSS